MVVFLQTQDDSSMQQEQDCSISQSTLCFEGTEQCEKPLSGYGTEAPPVHPAELAAVEADFSSTTPEQDLCLSSLPVADKQEQAAPQAILVTPQPPLAHQQQQQQHTAAFAEAKVHSKCCVCISLEELFHTV